MTAGRTTFRNAPGRAATLRTRAASCAWATRTLLSSPGAPAVCGTGACGISPGSAPSGARTDGRPEAEGSAGTPGTFGPAGASGTAAAPGPPGTAGRSGADGREGRPDTSPSGTVATSGTAGVGSGSPGSTGTSSPGAPDCCGPVVPDRCPVSVRLPGAGGPPPAPGDCASAACEIAGNGGRDEEGPSTSRTCGRTRPTTASVAAVETTATAWAFPPCGRPRPISHSANPSVAASELRSVRRARASSDSTVR